MTLNAAKLFAFCVQKNDPGAGFMMVEARFVFLPRRPDCGNPPGRSQKRMSKQVSICVIGSGYVGLVAAACFAEMGHKVICVDNDEDRVKTLCEGGVPIFEAHLPELLAKHRGQGVQFTTDLGLAVEHSEAIFIAVGT